MFRMFSRFRARSPLAARRPQGNATFLAVGAPLGFVLADGYVSDAWRAAEYYIFHLDRNAWFVVLCAVVIIGGICLRGFGSRSDY
jgi:hypothetical protein